MPPIIKATETLPHIPKLLIYTPFVVSTQYYTPYFTLDFWRTQPEGGRHTGYVEVIQRDPGFISADPGVKKLILHISTLLDALEHALRFNVGSAATDCGFKETKATPFAQIHKKNAQPFLCTKLLDRFLWSLSTGSPEDRVLYKPHPDLGPLPEARPTSIRDILAYDDQKIEKSVEKFMNTVELSNTPPRPDISSILQDTPVVVGESLVAEVVSQVPPSHSLHGTLMPQNERVYTSPYAHVYHAAYHWSNGDLHNIMANCHIIAASAMFLISVCSIYFCGQYILNCNTG